jgi:hypothetical protein
MWRMTNVVAMPMPMKVPTATIERGENRDSPQTPWPLAQPEPNRVPKPTINPPIAITGHDSP